MKLIGRGCAAWAGLLAVLVLTGCHSIDPYGPLGEPTPPIVFSDVSTQPLAVDSTNYSLRMGDELNISFFDTPTVLPPISDQVKEDGSITLIYNQRFQAAGKTIGALETEINQRYAPAYFVRLTAKISIANRAFSVGGEVKAPGRYPYPGNLNVLQAINIAGGLTEFAWHSHVRITRAGGGKPITVDYDKARKDSKKNLEIYPGDTIDVASRPF